MSRIQDILAKAERDGMTRRTQSDHSRTPTAAPVITPVNGSAALDRTPFVVPSSSRARGGSAPAAESGTGRAAAAESTGRTARATLHPALVAAIAPHAEAAERYRSIRTRLTMQEDTTPLRTLLVSSPGTGDGKSVTAANLALTMAQELQGNVVLVDADLRGSSVHALFGIPESPGLADVLAGDVPLEEAIVYLPDHRLTLLPAGRRPQFPTELLGSTAMRRVTDMLRARFDRILIDVPAVMPLADAGTVAPLTDGVVLVVRAGATQRPALDQALAVFEEEKVVGVVLNDVV